MTTLNLTITPERAVLSQDRALWFCGGDELRAVERPITESIDEAAAHTFIGDGVKPALVELQQVEKITCLPERKMLIGASGSFLHAALWPTRLAGELPEGDIPDIADRVPGMLRSIVEDFPSDVAELVIVHAGWSESEGRVIGYAYERSNGFEPMRLDKGHTLMPVANPDAPGYEQLAELWTQASDGQHVEAFHAELFKNQHWSYEQGLLRKGVHLSDAYTMASVDANSAVVLSDKLAEAA